MIFSKQLQLQVTILNTNILQLYVIKYSYQIQIIYTQYYFKYFYLVVTIFKQICWTNR